MVKPNIRSKGDVRNGDSASINPAYVAAGIAGAGLGMAALEQHKSKKKDATLIENVGTGIVTGMDTVAGAAGTTISTVMMPLMPVMLGGMALNMFVHPLASTIDGFTGSKIGNVTGKAGQALETMQGITFSQAGKKLGGPALGKNITSGVKSAAGFAAPMLDTVSKLPGLSGLHSNSIKQAPEAIGKTSIMHGAMRTAWVGGAALGVYGVARGFGSQLYALRQLQADLTGKDISDVSSLSVLTSSDLPKPVLEARSKLLKISGIHAVASTAGLVMALKSHLIDSKMMKMLGTAGQGMAGGMLAMMAYQVPDQIAEVAQGFIGEPILAHYNGLRTAQESGQALPSDAYAEFILAANEKLRNRGHTGQHFAMALGEQYAAEGMKVAAVLEEVSNGKMQERVDAITAKNAQEKAASPAAASHVDRLTQPKTVARPELGTFTNKLNQQAALAAMTPASPSIN